MGLLERIKRRRAEKKADKEAIATAFREERRAGDEPPRSISDTVEGAAGEFPPPP